MKTYRTYHRKSQCPWHMANHKRPENKTDPEKVFDRFSFPDWMQEEPHRCKKQSVSTGFIVLAWYKDTPDLLQRILESPAVIPDICGCYCPAKLKHPVYQCVTLCQPAIPHWLWKMVRLIEQSTPAFGFYNKAVSSGQHTVSMRAHSTTGVRHRHNWCRTSARPVSGIRPQEVGQACCSCDLYIEKGGTTALYGKGVPDTNLFITITHSPTPYRPAPPRLFGSSVKYVDAFRIAFTEKPKWFIQQKHNPDRQQSILLSSDTKTFSI